MLRERDADTATVYRNSMETINSESWEEFEGKIEEERIKVEERREAKKPLSVSIPLYRGHAKEIWSLKTTLERFSEEKNIEKEYSYRDYHSILNAVGPSISSLTENKYKIDPFEVSILHTPPAYEFMIYLRHHGFPSPLLDWTISPYVAAFFAFSEATEPADESKTTEPPDDKVAIYSFIEYFGQMEAYNINEPHIAALGPYAITHPRHFQQQCEYTVCLKGDGANRIYCSHEEGNFGESHHILTKYIIPSKERQKVIDKLDLMNINAYSLYGNEESLINLLAYREIEKKRR